MLKTARSYSVAEVVIPKVHGLMCVEENGKLKS